jgi:hypothetical protein
VKLLCYDLLLLICILSSRHSFTVQWLACAIWPPPPILRSLFDIHCRSILRCTTSNLSRHLSVSASIAFHFFLCHKVTKVITERGCYTFVVQFKFVHRNELQILYCR